jgi:hypothetical protein
VSGATVYNHDDAGHNNYLIVDSADIKGEGIIPYIYMKYNSGATGISDSVIVHLRKMRTTDNSRLDWIEGEDFTNLSTQADTAASDGNYGEQSTPGDSFAHTTISSSVDRTYIGMVQPIASVRLLSASDTYRIYCESAILGPTGPTYARTNKIEMFWNSVASDSRYVILFGWNAVPFPMFDIPKGIDEGSSPTLGAFISNASYINIKWEEVGSAAGGFGVDWLYLASVNDWLGLLWSSDWDWNTSYAMVLDAISEQSYVVNTSTYEVRAPARKYGPPYRKAIMRKGWDWRITFILGSIYDAAYTYSNVDHSPGAGYMKAQPISDSIYVNVEGIYFTLYPFSET